MGEPESPLPQRKRQRRLFSASVDDELGEFEEEDKQNESVNSVEQKLENFFKNKHGTLTKRWCLYEWFYPHIDSAYFKHNEFQECLNELGLAKITSLSRIEWSYIRGAMGKPRRFSRPFLSQERQKLKANRENILRIRNGESPLKNSSELISRHIPQQLPPGSKVLVLHDGSVKAGVVNAIVDSFSYRVKLQSTNTNITVGEDEIMLQLSDSLEHEAKKKRLNNNNLPSLPSTPTPRKKLEHPSTTSISLDNNSNSLMHPPIASPLTHTAVSSRAKAEMPSYTTEDLKTLASLLRLLERKELILSELNRMNSTPILNKEGEYEEGFRQQVALLIVQLDQTNKQIEQYLHSINEKYNSLSLPTSPIASNWYSEVTEKYKAAALSIVDEALDLIHKEHNSTAATNSSTTATTDSEGITTVSSAMNGNAASGVNPRCKEMIVSSISLLLHIQSYCTEAIDPITANLTLESALRECIPKDKRNLSAAVYGKTFKELLRL